MAGWWRDDWHNFSPTGRRLRLRVGAEYETLAYHYISPLTGLRNVCMYQPPEEGDQRRHHARITLPPDMPVPAVERLLEERLTDAGWDLPRLMGVQRAYNTSETDGDVTNA